MGGICGSGGSGTTQQQPQSSAATGNFQVFTPPNQPGLDQAYQDLLTPLYNQATGGVQSLGNVPPVQQVYPQASQIAQTQAAQGQLPGSYGPYGDTALGKAMWGLTTIQDIYGTPNNLINYGTQTGQAGLEQLPLLQAAATNPQIAQLVQNIVGNQYNAQALQGAQTAAGYGAQAAATTPSEATLLSQLGLALPGQGQQAQATTTAQVPLLQQLAQGSATRGSDLSTQAQGLLPQLQQLYGQTVPELLQAGGQYAAQAGATTPALQAIGRTGTALSGAAPGWAQQAQATTPALQAIGQTGANLAAAAPGYAQQALGTNAGLANAQQQILQTGLDPQGALFNQLTQQTRDQANAINALSGLAGTPYAAGQTADALRNFNINWQNQQLQRQATADQAAAGLAAQQLAGVTGAGNLLSGLTTAGGQLGLGTAAQQLANTQAGANILNQLTQGGAQVGLGAAQQQLANVIQGGQLYGNLVGEAGQLGGNLTQGQLGALTGAGNLYNQGALGAGTLAQAAGGLTGQGLADYLNTVTGAQNAFNNALGLGAGGANLAAQAANLPAQTYLAQQQQGLNAIGQQNQIATQGVSNLSNLINALGAAGTQPYTGILQALNLAQQPYNIAQTQGTNAFNALLNQANLGTQLYQQPYNVLNAINSQLGLGQTAAQVGGNLATQNQANTLQQLIGLGALGSGVNSLITGAQSGTGLGGLVSSAVGSLPTTGASEVPLVDAAGNVIGSDFSGASVASSGSGILGFLANLFSSAPAAA